MNAITMVTAFEGNWEIIYVNDELTIQYQSIQSYTMLHELKNYLPIVEIKLKDLTNEASERYYGDFPRRLTQYNESDFE